MSAITSVETVREDPDKVRLLRYLDSMLLDEMSQRISTHSIRSFTAANVKKLAADMKIDLDMAITSAVDRTAGKRELLVATIGEMVKALKRRKRGKSGAGQDGDLTHLDLQVQTAFKDLIFNTNGDKTAHQEEGTVDQGGEELNAGSGPAKVQVTNIFANLKFDPAAIARVKSVVNKPAVNKPPATSPLTNVESVNKTAVNKPPATTPLTSAKSTVTPTVDTSPGTSTDQSNPAMRPDHLSRKRKRAAKDYSRRGCNPKGLQQTSKYMVNRALGTNRVIGQVAAQANKLLKEDEWDVYGKSIALLLAQSCEDDMELVLRGSEILAKIYRDTTGTD